MITKIQPTNPYQKYAAPHVIAHRGGAGIAPENTLPAFDHAAALCGVHALETDIHMTQDGVIVAAHDDTIDAQSDGTGLLKMMDYADLLRADMGYTWSSDAFNFPFRGQNLDVPTLAQLLDRYPEHIINIDIKQHEPEVVEAFAKLIESQQAYARVVVGSFHSKTINYFRKLMPMVTTTASYFEVLTFFLLNKMGMSRLWRHRCQLMQIPERYSSLQLITPSFVYNLHKHAVQLHVWTVNDSADMDRLLSWGVDGLITDFPQRAIDIVQNKKKL